MELCWIRHFPQCFCRVWEICRRQDVPEKLKRPNRLREYNSKFKKLFNNFEGSLSRIILLGSLPPLFLLHFYFLPYRSFAYILWHPVLYSYGIPLYMNMCVCFFITFSWFFGPFPSVSMLCPISFLLVFCLLFLLSFRYLYPHHFKNHNFRKGMDLDGRGGKEDLGGVGNGKP